MANHKSAIKRNRQNIKRRDQNRAQRAAVRSAVKSVAAAISAGNQEEAKALARKAESVVASASKKGLYHSRNAQRKISRMVKAVNETPEKKS